MPIYEYQCGACKAVYELRQGFDAETTHKCEECGKGKAKRVLHAPPVVFKGSGWYVTDSRNKSSAVSGESKGETSDDSSPAAAAPEPATTETKAPKAAKPARTTKAADSAAS